MTGPDRGNERGNEPASGDGLTTRAARGAAWLGASSLFGQAFALGAAIVLARLLGPADFGRVAMANLMLALLGPLHDSGLATAFVARKDAVREYGATLTWSAPISGVLACALTAVAAPLLAKVFADPSLVDLTRALGVSFVFRGLGAPALAVLSKELAFRSRSLVLLCGTIVEGVVGVTCALAGAGYWALVAGQLAGAAAASAGAWALAPWWPLGRFSLAHLREMGRYGRHVVAGNFLGFIGSYLDNIVVGRSLGSTALGLYGAAFRWGRLPALVLATIISPIAFPSYVAVRDEPVRLRRAYLRLVRTVTSVTFPAGVGLLLVTPALVRFLYPPAWEGMIAPLQIFAVFGLVNSLVATTGDVFKAAGRPGWIAGLAAVHLPALVVLLWWLVARGPAGAAEALTLAAVVSGTPAVLAALRILELPVRALAAAIAPQTAATVAMAVIVEIAGVALSDAPAAVVLAVMVPIGVVAYAGALLLLDGAWVRQLGETVHAAVRRQGDLLT